MTPFGDVGRRGVRAYAARGGQTEEAYLKQLGELLTPEMAESALVDLGTGRPSDHCPRVPAHRAGASVCLSDVQPRLGISAGQRRHHRDTRDQRADPAQPPAIGVRRPVYGSAKSSGNSIWVLASDGAEIL